MAASKRCDWGVSFASNCITGIGFITTRELAKQGYQVVMACRDLEKAQAAKVSIISAVPSAKLEVHFVDLANLGRSDLKGSCFTVYWLVSVLS